MYTHIYNGEEKQRNEFSVNRKRKRKFNQRKPAGLFRSFNESVLFKLQREMQ